MSTAVRNADGSLDVVITRPPLGPFNGDMGTFSHLTIRNNPGFTCWAAELAWRDDLADLSRVPAATYKAVLQFSNRFQRMLYHLQNVPGPTPGVFRELCMLHNGNYAGDVKKGYKADIEGCTLLGNAVGILDPGAGFAGPQTAILGSVVTLNAFMTFTAGAPLNITYCDAPAAVEG